MRQASTRALLLAAAALLPGAAAAAQDARIPLSRDSSAWIAIGGQARLRTEGWRGFGFDSSAAADDAFALSRVLYHADLHLTRGLSVYAEVKSSLASNRTLPGGKRPADEDRLDLQQLFGQLDVPIGGSRLALRAGRADLRLGRERLVSPLDWTNTRRTFQGASAVLTVRGLSVQSFWARPLAVRQRSVNRADTTRQLYGVHAAARAPAGRLTLEAYWLRNESRVASFNGSSGYERRHTLGQRVWLAAPTTSGFDAELETAWQTGNVGPDAVRAWMAAGQAGWTFAGAHRVRVYLGGDAASGDATAGGRVETFNQLYPLGHAYLGYADVTGRQNVLDVSSGASAQLVRQLAGMIDLHRMSRASAGDAMYGVDGSLARTAGSGQPRSIGTELDLTLRYLPGSSGLVLQAGYSHFWRGDFIRSTGLPSRDTDWVYLQATIAL